MIGGAAAIPVVAAFDVPVYVAGILGAEVVVVEAQQAYQYHKNWITYRSTAESLKHEKYLYLARADAYAHSKNLLRLLAERIEGLISQEHARWISTRRRDDEEGKDESEEPEAWARREGAGDVNRDGTATSPSAEAQARPQAEDPTRPGSDP